MRVYIKPTIEFVELKPEERLACESGGGGGGGPKPGTFSSKYHCKTNYLMGKWCNPSNFKKYGWHVCK